MTSFPTARSRLLPVLLAAALFLTGCAERGEPAADIDPEAAAQTILDNVEFQASLTKADEGAAKNFYRLDDSIVEYAIYINGATVPAEEIAVLKTADEAGRAAAEEIVNKRIEDLQYQFEDYHPGELVKIDNPVIVAKGNVVVLVLADDQAQAKKVVEGLF